MAVKVDLHRGDRPDQLISKPMKVLQFNKLTHKPPKCEKCFIPRKWFLVGLIYPGKVLTLAAGRKALERSLGTIKMMLAAMTMHRSERWSIYSLKSDKMCQSSR